MSNPDRGDQYIYPDRHETITLNLIGETEPYKGYWELSENKVLNMVMKEIVKRSLDTKMLDAGCGFGRLILKFSSVCKRIYANEPDIERYTVCKNNLVKWSLNNQVELFHCNTDELDYQNFFDVIICSHVIQHVPEMVAENMIHSFRRMLKSNGILIITTSHSLEEKEQYYMSYMDNNIRYEKPIDSKAFNLFENRKGKLPIKFFTYDSIDKMMKKSKFQITDYHVYHHNRANRLFDMIFGPDLFINLNPNIKDKNGRDLYVCATAK